MAVEAWHVIRTLRALEILAVAPRSAPELAADLQAHVRTARRLLKRLESEGYVYLGDGRRRQYRPTMRIVALAGQVVARAELTQTAVPYLLALRDEVARRAICASRAICPRSAWSTLPPSRTVRVGRICES